MWGPAISEYQPRGQCAHTPDYAALRRLRKIHPPFNPRAILPSKCGMARKFGCGWRATNDAGGC